MSLPFHVRAGTRGPTALGRHHGRQRRILYVQPAVAIGGAERQASLVLPLLEPHGVEAVAVAGPGAAIAAWFRQSGLERVVLSPNFPGTESFSLMRLHAYVRLTGELVRELDRLHEERPFDAVVGSLGFGWAVAGVCAQRWGIPSIWRAGGLSFGSTSDRASPEAMALRLLARLVEPSVLLCNAHAVERYWAEVLPTIPTRVVHNGVAMPEPLERPARAPDAPFTVAFAGRLAPEKNVPALLEAVAIARVRGADVRLVLAGPGDPEPIEARVAELRLEPFVRFDSVVSDMSEYYRSCDAFVLPSDSEGCANVVLEAMAHGLPVIATAVGGTPELVRHGVDGLLVPRRNPWALALAMIELAQSPQRREALGEAARMRAAQFSPERAARAIARLVHEVVEGEVRPPARWARAIA